MSEHEPFCPCEACQVEREAWTARQPPLLADLDARDGEDEQPDAQEDPSTEVTP